MTLEGGCIVGYLLELSSANIIKPAWKGCYDYLPVSTQLRNAPKRMICVYYPCAVYMCYLVDVGMCPCEKMSTLGVRYSTYI